jgi:hypothetical protein
MDWIGRWFGVSPDGGSGSLEGLVIAVLIACAVVLGVRWLPFAQRSICSVRRMLRT